MSRLRALLAALLMAGCSTAQPAATAVTIIGPVASSWTMFRGDPARDGHPFGVTLTPSAAARLSLTWSVDMGSPIVSGPVVAGGILVVGTEGGTLEAFSTEQGAEVWKQTGLGPITGQPLIAGGNLYAGSSDGHLYAFELETGTRIWDWRAPGDRPALWGGPVVYQGLLLVGVASQLGAFPEEAGRLVALDPASGDRLWATCLMAACGAGDGAWSSIAIDPSGIGFIGVGNPDDAVAAVDVGIGRILWRTSLYPDGGRGLDVGATPVLFSSQGHERVAAGGLAGTFAVLDAATGSVVWSRDLVRGGTAGGLIGSPGYDGRALYVPSAGSPSGMLAVGPDDGAVLWRDLSRRPVSSSPAVGLGVLVFGEGSAFGNAAAGAVVAISTVDGHELWRQETGSAVVAPPAMVGEAVFAADRRGRVLAFRPAG